MTGIHADRTSASKERLATHTKSVGKESLDALHLRGNLMTTVVIKSGAEILTRIGAQRVGHVIFSYQSLPSSNVTASRFRVIDGQKSPLCP